MQHEVISPAKNNRNQNKRKGGDLKDRSKVYRRVEVPLLTNSPHEEGEEKELAPLGSSMDGSDSEREPKKKKPTLGNSENSAAATMQRYPQQ